MQLRLLKIPGIEIDIYRENEYRKLHVSDFFNCRLGDKIGSSVLVDLRRNQTTEDEAIICLDCEYNEIPETGTYIEAKNYFRHQYDAIVKLRTKQERDRFCEHFKKIFPDWMTVAAHLWEVLPGLKKHGYYVNIHSWPEVDLWWHVERRKLGIPVDYLAVHILTDSTYHPEKLVDFDTMKNMLLSLSGVIPIVIVGGPVNPKIEHKNVWDLCHSGYNINHSIAIVNRCKAFLGGDTGITHVAGALGKCVVELFPGDDRWHSEKYDAGVSIEEHKLKRIFLESDGTFDKVLVFTSVEEMWKRGG